METLKLWKCGSQFKIVSKQPREWVDDGFSWKEVIMQQPTYIIIQDKTIHHEGDERSRTHPGHGYPAWSETVQTVRYFKDEDAFEAECFALTKTSEKYRAFACEEFIIKQKLELVRK